MKLTDVSKKGQIAEDHAQMRKDDDRPWRKDAPPLNKAPSNPDYPSQKFNHNDWMSTSKKMEEEGDGIDRMRKDDNRPWRKDAPPLNKTPSNPDYPTQKFNHNDWMASSKKMEEDSSEMPENGDAIRTHKSGMEGRVERVEGSEVFYRTGDGRLMKTPISNTIVITKLADCDDQMLEAELNEISNEILTKYKTAASKETSAANKAAADAESAADARPHIDKANKRYSGIIKATNKQFSNDKKQTTKGGVKEDNEESNFTADDIKKLEGIQDLQTLKYQAKELIKGKAARKMKPEKVAFFYDKIDDMTKPMTVIKLMYDLLLSGEGNQVIGSRNSMGQNSYRSRFGEGSMGGINRSRPAQDVSYEKVLDRNPQSAHSKVVGESFEDRLNNFLEALDPGTIEEDMTPWGGYTPDDKKANALKKAPKSSMHGSTEVPFDQMVKDTIDQHGVKWAFDFYVRKHGLPPKQFQIYAGLTANPPAAPKSKTDWTDPSISNRRQSKNR